MAAKFDIKGLAVQHGEKAVLGIVLLLVVWFLVSARWSTYERRPSEFSDKVNQSRATLQANNWGEAQEAEHTLAEDQQPARVVAAALDQEYDVSDLQLANKITVRLYDEKEPLRMLEPARVQQLIADTFYAYLEFPVEEEAEESDTDETTEPMDDETTPNPFESLIAESASNNSGGSAMSGPGSSMSSYYSDFEMQMSQFEMASNTTETSMTDMMSQYYSSGRGGPGGAGASSSGAPAQVALNRNGRLYPYVSVRAVFDVREQIRKIQEATNLEPLQAAQQFRLMDFELQRRMLLEPDLWTEWEQVQIQVAKDILDEVSRHSADVVSSAVTDPTITMPLPGRIIGDWKLHASHPLLEEFTLSEEEMLREIELNQRIFEEFMERNQSLSSAIRPQGGFSDMTLDTRQMQAQMMGMSPEQGYGMSYGMSMQMQSMGMTSGYGSSGYGASGRSSQGGPQQSRPSGSQAQDFFDQLLEAEDDEDRQTLLRQWIEEKASSEGQLLLFRYIDFDVRPGETYQYRVRIEIDNPNFEKRASDADGIAEVVETPSVWTEWSNETVPTRVEPAVHYYLTQIDPARISRTELPTPRLSFYQWGMTLGSLVHNDSVRVPIGGAVGGTAPTEQYDVAKEVYTPADGEDADFTFTTDDFLVGALPDISINRTEHTDVTPPRGAGGSLRLTQAVIVIDDSGELRTIDPVSTATESSRMESLYAIYSESEVQPFKRMREGVTAATDTGPFGSEFADQYGYGSAEMMGGYSGGYGGGYGAPSDNRRIRSRGGQGGRGGGSNSGGSSSGGSTSGGSTSGGR